MKQTIAAIVAISENRVIGKDNQLPWHLPADLKHFKTITTNHPILMGRKTYQSIGRPLPNRTNIIISRDEQFKAEGCKVASSIEKAIQLAAEEAANELFIIGGAEIYRAALPIVERIYLTVVHETVEGDAFFPTLNDHEWREVSNEFHAKDEKNLHDYRFIVLERL